MEYKRILAIGDIHGCADTVKELVRRLEPTPDDVMVFLGDYVDRGDKSFEVVDYLIELDKTHNCVFIKGNHEDMWVSYLDKTMNMSDHSMFFYNGGTSTLKSYCDNIIDETTGDVMKTGNGLGFDDLPQSHRDFYNNLKIIHEIEDFIFVHAGVNPEYDLEHQTENDLLWIRNQFLFYNSTIFEGKTIVHGHTPMEPHELDKYHNVYDDKINLDSACVFGYTLTAMDVRTRKATKIKMMDMKVA